MSPRRADETVRAALVEAAARLIATEGSRALTLRRVAHEVGTSTMAVYTHFGGMDELRREVRREGFDRFRQYLSLVEDTDDPVADLALQGAAYYLNGTTNPNLYRAMFMEGPMDESDAAVGIDTFERLVDGVRRCIAAGRFDPAEPVGLANQLWALSHGVVTLELAHMFSAEQAVAAMAGGGQALFVAYGDDEAAVGRSLRRSRERLGDLIDASSALAAAPVAARR